MDTKYTFLVLCVLFLGAFVQADKAPEDLAPDTAEDNLGMWIVAHVQLT